MNLHSIKPCSVRAPQLSGEYVDWLNVERPLQLGDLRGKVTVLHFWTYSCINCLHNLRAIARGKAFDLAPERIWQYIVL